jgi:hypothetical protein
MGEVPESGRGRRPASEAWKLPKGAEPAFVEVLPLLSSAGQRRPIAGGVGTAAAFFFAIQLLGGLLLLSGYFVPLSLTLLAAELYNIRAFHLTLAPASIAPALIACVQWVLVFLQYRESFNGIFSAKRAT